jgi:hypothetical protein
MLTPGPSYLGSRDQEDWGLRPAQANSSYRTPSQKYPTQKRAEGVAQVVERLPSKAQSSNPSTTKKKKKILSG